MALDPSTIVEVVRIEDTREWVEGPDDRWHAIAGSGVPRQCDRCGRTHEVHATVRLADGGEAVVGTGCAKGSSVEPAVKKGATSAKTVARLEAQLAAWSARLEALRALYAEVKAGPIPLVEDTTYALSFGQDKGTDKPAVRCGDAVRILLDNEPRSDAAEQVRHLWISKEYDRRAAERGLLTGRRYARVDVGWLKESIHRAERSLKRAKARAQS